MDFDIFNKEEFNCLTPKQKSIMKDIMEMSKNVSSGEAASIILRMIPVLESEGKLSSQQKRAVMMCIIENMNSQEKERATYLFKMAGII